MNHQTTTTIRMKGKIVRGVGDGEKYLSMPEFAEQFEKLLEAPPFPGTLNVRLENIGGAELEKIEEIKKSRGLQINGFKKGGKQYLPGICIHCAIFVGNRTINGLIFFPERAHHSSGILEVISNIRIRDAAGPQNEVEVEIGKTR